MNMRRGQGCLVSVDKRQGCLVSTDKRQGCFDKHGQEARMPGEH